MSMPSTSLPPLSASAATAYPLPQPGTSAGPDAGSAPDTEEPVAPLISLTRQQLDRYADDLRGWSAEGLGWRAIRSRLQEAYGVTALSRATLRNSAGRAD